jgi:hypothetical protein
LGHALPTVSFCEYHYTKANKGRKLPVVDGEVLAAAPKRQKNKIMNPPMAAISEEGAAQTGGENEVAVEDFDTKGDAAEESPPTRGRCRKLSNLYDEAKETPVPSRHHRQQKSGEHGDSPLPPPDHLRCRRNDGKKWRCLGHALPTVSLCEYHYTKANKGKKLPADGEVLAVALQRLMKNKEKGRKNGKDFCNNRINKWLVFDLFAAALFACLLFLHITASVHQEVIIKLCVASFELSGNENLVDCNLIIRRGVPSSDMPYTDMWIIDLCLCALTSC